jgi:hypothetical protein
MERIIKITKSFFDLNDIGINGRKSELLVINASVNKEQQHIIMGKNNAVIRAADRNSPIRYLGYILEQRKAIHM